MKKLLMLAVFAGFTCASFAQNIDLRRKISVSGTAQQEITPDIINVSISLQEYMNGKNKISIDQLENQLEDAVKAAGIAKEDFTINDISSYKDYYEEKKNSDFLAGKQFMIRFHDLDKFNQILHRINPKGIQSTEIVSYDYSKMTEVKRNLKIQAMLAAKEKATYLLTSIDEKLGGVIDITEAENTYLPYLQASSANTVMNYQASSHESDIDYKKIKLSYQINATFEIAK